MRCIPLGKAMGEHRGHIFQYLPKDWVIIWILAKFLKAI